MGRVKVAVGWVLLLGGCSSAPRPASEPSTPRQAALPEVAAASPAAPDTGSVSDERTPTSEASNDPAWLGVLLGRSSTDAGVAIENVEPDSPASRAGLVAGDVLLSINGRSVETAEQVRALVAALGAGSRARLAILRDGSPKLVGAELEAFPGPELMLRRRFLGRPAPPPEGLTTLAGEIAPELHRGRVLVLEFWASWCIACRALLPTMNRWHDEHAAKGVDVVGVTTEPALDVASAVTALDLHYPVLVDPEGATTVTYFARLLPTVFVIDRAGIVRDTMTGFDYARLPEIEALIVSLAKETR